MNKDLPLHPDIYEPSPGSGALRQGELITGLRSLTYSEIKRKTAKAEILTHDYALVVSQDCDLDWDFPVRYGEKQSETVETHKLMQDILFCIVTTARMARTAHNTPKLTFMNSTKWSSVSGNIDERFHFFEEIKPQYDAKGKGLPELVADFKLYFSMPVEAVYMQIHAGKALRRCVLKTPYLEHFCQRFCFYQGRVALPAKHFSMREQS